MHHGWSDEYEQRFNPMIGEQVVIQHPTFPEERHEGICVGIAWHPTMTIERPNGSRVSRPVEWASLKEETDGNR